MRPKVLYLGIFGLEFKKTIAIFEIRLLKFVYLQHFAKKTKMPKFATRSALFGYFWAWLLKKYCHIGNQHPQVCLFAKFREKAKMSKFGTKSVLFGYSWARILKKILSHLKSARSNLSKMSL